MLTRNFSCAVASYLLWLSGACLLRFAWCAELPVDWRTRFENSVLNDNELRLNKHPAGDIIWDDDNEDRLDFQTEALRTGRLSSSSYWPNHGRNIPYAIQEWFAENEKQLIRKALQAIQVRTSSCITFKPRNAEDDFIMFKTGSRCEAHIGRRSGETRVHLSAECMTSGMIQHEVLHALGLFHEQSRPDRNDFIEIFHDNIQSESLREYEILPHMPTHGTQYDLDSIMHYGPFEFAKIRTVPVIIPKSKQHAARMGQRTELSALDIVKLQTAYRC